LQPSSPDIFAAYARSHLFAIPSRWEGFSNALAEAMSHGLPAIGFRGAAGVAHLIADGETGWLADGLDDEVALARALHHAMSDGAERLSRGRRAVAAMGAYEPEVQFDRWAAEIDALCDGCGDEGNYVSKVSRPRACSDA
jgi:glycosyltransferase involved in cell wall biosynthesis